MEYFSLQAPHGLPEYINIKIEFIYINKKENQIKLNYILNIEYVILSIILFKLRVIINILVKYNNINALIISSFTEIILIIKYINPFYI